MEKNELKIFQTAILLIDKDYNSIMYNELLPYLNKAEQIVKIIKCQK